MTGSKKAWYAYAALQRHMAVNHITGEEKEALDEAMTGLMGMHKLMLSHEQFQSGVTLSLKPEPVKEDTIDDTDSDHVPA